MPNRTPEEKITRARARIAWRQPFFSAFMLRSDIIEASQHSDAMGALVQTMATDGKYIYWNRDFVDTITDKQVEGVLIHECLHIMFKHHLRIGDRKKRKFNVACDYVIDPIVLDVPDVDLPDGPGMEQHKDRKYDGHSAEQVYEMLPDMPEDEMQMGAGGVIEPMGEDGQPMSSDEKSMAEAEIDRITVQAHDAAKHAGKVPAGIEGYINALKEPKVDWEARLRRFVGGENPEGYTTRKFNRAQFWYGHAIEPGIEKTGVKNVVICVDVSGSVSNREIEQFLGEMNCISEEFSPELVTVIQHDSKVQHVQEYERGDIIDQTSFKRRACGGTCVQPVMRYIEKHIDVPDRVIWMTDMGIFDWGDDPGYPVLWIATTREKAPYGETVYVDIA